MQAAHLLSRARARRPLIFSESESSAGVAVDPVAALFFVSFVVGVGWTLLQARLFLLYLLFLFVYIFLVFFTAVMLFFVVGVDWTTILIVIPL